MHNRIYTILTAALTTVCAHAAVPLKWTVETSRVQPVTFEAYHGEELSLEATLPFVRWQRHGLVRTSS